MNFFELFQIHLYAMYIQKVNFTFLFFKNNFTFCLAIPSILYLSLLPAANVRHVKLHMFFKTHGRLCVILTLQLFYF